MKKLMWGLIVGILLGVKESSVGAIVSGPKKMREHVAVICSESNLHFESISFTW